MTKRRALLAWALAVMGLWLLYRAHVRPWIYAWGASAKEIETEFPGDELVRPGLARTTRAIDIGAPVEHVWPWLAQLGEDRGGFCSYSTFERAVGANVHNAQTVHTEWQNLDVGDVVWLAKRYGEHGCQVVAELQPKGHLVLVSKADFERIQRGERAGGSWAFHLCPVEGGTRLLVRGSGGAVGHAIFDVLHFIMERKMLKGIRRRAEHVF
jgi:hypothetical protein